jgi:exodeoxyribonuclease VII large subunit
MLDDKRMLLMHVTDSLTVRMELINKEKRSQFAENASRLSALNPLDVIARGYGAVYDSDKKIVDSVEKINVGDDMGIRLSDGVINAKVTEINKT